MPHIRPARTHRTPAHPTKGFTPRRVQCGIRRLGRCQVFGARGAKLRMLDRVSGVRVQVQG